MAAGSRTFERGESIWIRRATRCSTECIPQALGIVSTRILILVGTDTIYNTVSGSTSNGIIVSGAGCEKNEGIEDQRAVRTQ